VLANNPYLYFRLQEPGGVNGALKDLPANDTSVNNRDGVYRGTVDGPPTGGAAGAGTGSDTAVAFPDASVSGLHYLRTTDSRSFGSQTAQSSYEFIFKANTPDMGTQQALFGVFNAAVPAEQPVDDPLTPIRTGNQAVQIEFNTANANNILDTDTKRMYLRDESGLLIYGNITHGNLLDGQYHHFVVTADVFALDVSDKIKAYIDGLAVPVTVAQSSAGAPVTFGDFTVDSTFAARNVRGTVGLEANITLDEAALYGNTVLTAEQVAANATAAGFVIPEPGSLTLAGFAAIGLLARRRRPA
jgi:hypothetical protein